jgi:octaprenyl-diphosphate synthase
MPTIDTISSVTNIAARKLSLKGIHRPIDTELEHFRGYFRGAMRSRVFLMDQVIQYLLRQKGKQMRPILVLLSAKAAGGISESTYRGAALVELLHTATLVHDDVVDDSDRRRGMFSINALWKNKIAVLLGDFLLSRGLLLALDHKDYQLLHIVSDAVKRMSEGELLQIEKARKLDIDEATYFQIISDKTASLLSACTSCGASSASADESTVLLFKEFGQALGMAFQIRDDLFDYGVKDVGKPLGIDLQEKKMTLPLIYSLSNASKTDKKRIMSVVRKKGKSKNDIREVSTFVSENGGITYATEKMMSFASEAHQILDRLPENEARNSLADLVTFTVTRSK